VRVRASIHSSRLPHAAFRGLGFGNAGARGAKLVILRLDGDFVTFNADHAPSHDQLQRTNTFQEERPTYRQFNGAAGGKRLAGCEEDATAADIHGRAVPGTLDAATIQEPVLGFQLERKALVRTLLKERGRW
jgi:hypothetical protein